MSQTLSSKEFVASFKQSIAARAEACRQGGVAPTLAVVLVGEKPDSVAYQRSAIKRAQALGVDVREYNLPEASTTAEVQAALREINEDAAIHGCLLLRPMPAHIDDAAVCETLAVHKDSDGITTASMGGVFANNGVGFAPCTPSACLHLLDAYGISVEGKKVAVVGRSLVVGRPLALMLLHRNATVTVCHSRTPQLAEVTRQADIVITATGRAKAYGPQFFREGQIVLDVGTNFDENGMLCGDVDFDAVAPVVAAITPVPGGIGGITTCALMDHVVVAAERAGGKAASL
ncbi:MAG: bifunctional 5,10-methylenetetrahydrofolate dehydrogenase/5,10-methenyltetrahydrofolate cyclohydrolase [Coriobacteriia bacterium]|nr:bifunctional 5,10-methylenetetrahydrofolate dehydrogenase/5,10-methenyltetrahydrofolate cyclohydrolase [Coriobacteriia bacterium]